MSAVRAALGLTAARVARALPQRLLARLVPAGQRFDPSAPPPAVQLPDTAARLLVGPVNSAGQGHAWARAAERLPGVGARAMAVRGPRDFGFAADQSVPLGDYRWSRAWQRAQRRAVLADATHVLLESARPLFGDVERGAVEAEVSALRERGIHVALAFHGSDLRDPAAHRARERHSPYAEGLWALTPALTARARHARSLIAEIGCPVFVSTPDLLLDVPEAVWLPVVVEPERWRTDVAPLAHGGRPVVAHAPSTAIVKGTDLIDGTLRALEAEGLIEYRRLEGLPSAQMPAAYGAADIVLDQFRIGSYGAAACEAMAAGRIVVSHVAAAVRERVQVDTGLAMPIVQAEADELEAVLRALLADPSPALATAAAGPAFVAAVHDGALSARQLAPWLEGSR